ncbi:unnamed protein product [Periconia digitata]|uniref:Uncharacterized protein n=1 Tax=Periconia digitata TaxID=1303443 RepID=A0A9W4UN74_9PLEO|nr:unnamed protein product [Periconia digitata]
MDPEIIDHALRKEIVRHHVYKGQKRYLIRYSREGHHCAVHDLVTSDDVASELVDAYVEAADTDLSIEQNRGGQRIRINRIDKVFDMVYCRDSNDNYEQGSPSGFYDCFVLLQWQDEYQNIRETWEFIQTLVDLMESDHIMSLLGVWSIIAEKRRENLLAHCIDRVEDVLGGQGWQTL